MHSLRLAGEDQERSGTPGLEPTFRSKQLASLAEHGWLPMWRMQKGLEEREVELIATVPIAKLDRLLHVLQRQCQDFDSCCALAHLEQPISMSQTQQMCARLLMLACQGLPSPAQLLALRAS